MDTETWSAERDGRLVQEVLSPEVAQKDWVGDKKKRLQRVRYWQAFDRKRHAGVPLMFEKKDVGMSVETDGKHSIVLKSGGSRKVHFLSNRSSFAKGMPLKVKSVVAKVGGRVEFQNGVAIENGYTRHPAFPYFKYVDMQTPQKPEWSQGRDGRRFEEVLAGKTAYKPFETDKSAENRRPSSYSQAIQKRFAEEDPSADLSDLGTLSDLTGVPLDILKKVHAKGMAAWKSGHRAGASQHAWGVARVHSFLMLGCTVFANDDQLAAKAAKSMSDDDLRAWTGLPIKCPDYKLKKDYFQRAVKRLNGSRFLNSVCTNSAKGRAHVCV